MKEIILAVILSSFTLVSCGDNPEPTDGSILGYELLNQVNGHWVGFNDTAFGDYDWFAFDFRPISSSHSHSIYEGATAQNIITSIFLADFEGEQKIMARNGGWLGTQYRATYFVLDQEQIDSESSYYRLVDAVGGVDRSYIEFRFANDSIYIDAYKDNSGSLDKPIHHMGFAGANLNPSYAETAVDLFDFPQMTSEVDLNDQFTNLIDPDSALFLEEADDPFPKSDHGYLSDLSIDLSRNTETETDPLLLYMSIEPIVNEQGVVDFDALNNRLIRTISIKATENNYTATYLHPDEYYLTVFSDRDGNGIPSSGDFSSISSLKDVPMEVVESAQVEITILIP